MLNQVTNLFLAGWEANLKALKKKKRPKNLSAKELKSLAANGIKINQLQLERFYRSWLKESKPSVLTKFSECG